MIVVEAGGDVTNAVIGEIMVRIAEKKGVAGFVIDGAVRDAGALARASSRSHARGVTHRGPYKDGPGEINVPVALDSMVIHPGDIVVGDEDAGWSRCPRPRRRRSGCGARQVQAEARTMKAIADGTLDRSQVRPAPYRARLQTLMPARHSPRHHTAVSYAFVAAGWTGRRATVAVWICRRGRLNITACRSRTALHWYDDRIPNADRNGSAPSAWRWMTPITGRNDRQRARLDGGGDGQDKSASPSSRSNLQRRGLIVCRRAMRRTSRSTLARRLDGRMATTRPSWQPGLRGASRTVMLMDIASVVARGKIVEASKRREQIPQGWALDRDGKPTTEAAVAEKGRDPADGRRQGSALAIMVEVLSGVLGGGRFAEGLGNLYQDFETPQDIGHFFLALRPPVEGFEGRVGDLVGLQAQRAAGRRCGDPDAGRAEARRRARSLAEGIDLPDNVARDLDAVAELLGVAKLA